MTEEDIKNVIKTLRMIKEECEIHTSCKDCIFSNRGMCAMQLTSIPETWAIKEKVKDCEHE